MSDVIIDTNVLVVANGQNVDVAAYCLDACIRFVKKVRTDDVVLVDGSDEIRKEYARNLQEGRPYQLGMRLLFEILQYSVQVRVIDLHQDANGDFLDFPPVPELEAFDRSDRKFAALSKKTGTPVTNATDSDWADFPSALNRHGITVQFLCGHGKNEGRQKPSKTSRSYRPSQPTRRRVTSRMSSGFRAKQMRI
jgi:hypothetical protein